MQGCTCEKKEEESNTKVTPQVQKVLSQLQLTKKSNKSLNKRHCDLGGNIRSCQSFQSTVVLPEQVHLEPFLEGGEKVSVSDGGGELIPPARQGKSLCWDRALLSGGTTRQLSEEDRRWRVGV